MGTLKSLINSATWIQFTSKIAECRLLKHFHNRRIYVGNRWEYKRVYLLYRVGIYLQIIIISFPNLKNQSSIKIMSIIFYEYGLGVIIRQLIPIRGLQSDLPSWEDISLHRSDLTRDFCFKNSITRGTLTSCFVEHRR